MKRSIALFLICSLISVNTYSQDLQPSTSKKELTLLDLRIPEGQYTKDLQEVRDHKLKIHKHLAGATLGLAAASVLTAILAKKKVNDDRAARGGRMDSADAKDFNLHLATAGLTLVSYFTTAYFSISAPKAETMEDNNSVKWHKRLAYIHMPAMIIGPILGMKAISDYRKGRNPSGISKLHAPIMMVGVAALAGAAVVIEF